MVSVNSLLDNIVSRGDVSDLHLTVGRPPMIRVHGDLTSLGEVVLTGSDLEDFVKEIVNERQHKTLLDEGSVDFGLAFSEEARFRVNIYKQKGVYGMALRLIPSEILTLETIGLPPTLKDLLFRPRGLVLVTGPTGSGKSTTLATMIDIINKERACHIITIEDPIEYYHTHKKSIVTQREIGEDTPDFEESLTKALRQDPDVILVGEMRNLETIRAALTASETGHLVFATLHTTGAASTVDRIIDAFPADEQEQIRTLVSSTLVAVISQTLIPRIDKPGRAAAFEIMIMTPAIQNLIRENKTFRINSDIQTGAKYGMNTLDMCLYDLYQRKIISYGDVLTKAQDPDFLVSKIKGGKE